MEYLGEFLSTTNKITQDEDTIIKYFYYRPDKYDNPAADLENIFSLRAVSGFPQIGDVLSENNNYMINDIDIAKRIDDTNTGVKKVSYVVTCTYQPGGIIFQENKRKREDQQREKDKNGNVVTNNTRPWEYKNTFSRQPVQVEVPFIKAYNANNEKVIDVLNTAGKRLISSTSRYRFEYNIKFNSLYAEDALEAISGCLVNDSDWEPSTEGLGLFSSGTCLIFPVTYNNLSWQAPTSGIVQGEIYDYKEYTVKFIYDPQGWDKVLLNIGTWAKFSENSPAEQIFSYRVKQGNSWGELTYGNLAEVELVKTVIGKDNVTFEKVTDPLPLLPDGSIDELAIRNPENNPYGTVSFQEFQTYNFNLFGAI